MGILIFLVLLQTVVELEIWQIKLLDVKKILLRLKR